MWFRKVLPVLLAAGPFVMLGGIVISAHSPVSEDHNLEFGTQIHKEILAYREPISRVSQLFGLPPNQREQRLEAVTASWLDGRGSGKLKTIRPVMFQVSSSELIIADISEAKFRLIGEWVRLSEKYRITSEFEKEAKCLARLVNLANIDKYYDMNSVHHCSMVQARAIDRLVQLVPQLSEAALSGIKKDIVETSKATGSLVELAEHIKYLHEAFLAQKRKAPVPVEFALGYQALEEAANTAAPDSLQKLRQVSTTIVDEDFVKIGSLARSSIQSEASYKLALNRLVTEISR